MSDDDETGALLPDADDNRHVCPNCGNDCLDGQGSFGRSFNRVRTDGKFTVSQKWVQLRCPDCDQTFALMEDEIEQSLELDRD